MSRNKKTSAILQLLSKLSYKEVLILNGWDDFNDSISIYTKKLVLKTSNDLKNINIQEKYSFDLVFAFSPTQSDFKFISKYIYQSEVEFICLSHSRYTYNKVAIDEYKSKTKRYDDLLGVSGIKKNIFKYLNCNSPLQYNIFPSIIEPELILTKAGFKLYRRYWSWRKGIQDRGLFSLMSEIILIKYFKCSFFAPLFIFKVIKSESSY